MLTIDGSEGGGQLLRTALSLSVVTGTPFRIEDLRGGRPNPGLRPQHLAAVELVGDLCDAAVEGAELDSETLTLRPRRACHTSLEADIPTAGSITLLFDTVLPIAVASGEPFEVTSTGGTNVKWAPTVEYHQFVKLPLLATWGVDAAIDLHRTGFYPAGDGSATMRTTPSSPDSIELETRGAFDRVVIYSIASEVLADRKVADRQATHASDELEDAGYRADVRRVEYVPTRSTGSSLLLRGVFEHSVVGFDALGERGRTSEEVADGAVGQFTAFADGEAPVDPFMADQLLVLLALVGGRVRIPTVTPHVETNLDLITTFGSDMRLERGSDGGVVVAVSAHPAVQ